MLEAAGDGGAGEWRVISFDPGAHDVMVRDLTIDTSGMTNTDEQSHAIGVGSPLGTGLVEDVRIERVRFVHPSTPGGARKGDCLRLGGNTPESAVRRVTVIGATFTNCARSGIGVQRNVFDLVVMGNQFAQSSDQDLDMEPSGTGQNGSLTLVGNVFRDDPSVAQGDGRLPSSDASRWRGSPLRTTCSRVAGSSLCA